MERVIWLDHVTMSKGRPRWQVGSRRKRPGFAARCSALAIRLRDARRKRREQEKREAQVRHARARLMRAAAEAF